MPGMTGFDLVRKLEDGSLPAVVFVTAYDEYAVRAFEVNAVDYLLKPVTQEQLIQSLNKHKNQYHPGQRAEVPL